MSRSRATVSGQLRTALIADRKTIRGLRDNLRDAQAEIGKLKGEADCLRSWQKGQNEVMNRLNTELRHKGDLIDRLARANTELHRAVAAEQKFARQLADAIEGLLAAGVRQRTVKRWDAADFARVDGEFAEVGDRPMNFEGAQAVVAARYGDKIGTAHKT